MSFEGLSCLKFVRGINGDQQCEVMLSAAKAIEETGQAVVWVEPEVIEASSINKSNIYLLDTFDTPVYRRLSGKTRVIGPMVVLAHLKHGVPLPVSRQPTFTMAMHGVTVCCTQTGERETRTKLMELVKLMGGRTSGDFTRHVTHLIAGQVGSTKYQVAQSLSTPVLQPSWVFTCWEEGKTNLLRATTEEIISAHRCPPLSGCVVSSTGFCLEGRARLKELAEKNGAEYSSNLIRDSCTHLIVGDVTSKKYQYGRDWKIHCVSEGWLHQSIKTRYCMNEKNYPVKEPGSSKNNEVIVVEEPKNDENTVSRKRVVENQQKEQNVSSKKSKMAVTHRNQPIVDIEEDEDNDLLTQYQNAEMPVSKPMDRSATQMFEGMRVSINPCLSGEASTAVAREMEKRGASVVPLSAPCDYHVTSLSCPQSVPSDCGAIVTLIWLEMSLASDSLLDPQSHFMFEPLPVALSNKVLEGCVITISQFDGLEREHLACLARGLGAVVQECFARYPSKGLLATTQLVLREPNGQKYQSALSWGVKAVSDKWLFACAVAQKIVPVDEYLVKPLEATDVKVIDHAPKMDVTEEEEESMMAKSFHPNYDLQDVSLCMTQTDGPNTQLAGVFECNINKALETITDAEKEASAGSSHILEGVVIVVHRKLSSQKGELHRLVTSLGGKWRAAYSKQCTHYVYQGRLCDVSRDKQLQQAKNSGCVLVSHHWLLACSQTGQREDEGLYPCNYDPNRAIPILSQRLHTKDQLIEQENKDDNIPTEDEDNMDDQSELAPPSTLPSLPHDDSSDILKKQCDEILQMIERNGKKERPKRNLRNRDGFSPVKSRSPENKRRATWKFNRRGGSPPEGIHVSDSQLMTVTYEHPEDILQQEKLLAQMRNQQSISLPSPIGNIVPRPDSTTPLNLEPMNINKSTVDKVDKPRPSGAPNRLTRSMSRVENFQCTPVAPPTCLPIVTNVRESTIEESLYNEKASKHNEIKTNPTFILSSLNVQEKADYGSLIQDLGGQYYESDHFVTSCTHLVVGKASRTEKYLAACASGKWILGRSYLEACRVESRFVEETEYEWGVHLIASDKATALDRAPKKWREKLSGTKDGAFTGWKVMLCVEPFKQEGLKRLLEAGGAFVIPSIKTKSDFEITHAFLNPSVRDPPVPVKSLVDKGVHCLRPDYIAEYLQKETLPTSEQFILPEALKLLKET